jgi:hypothetical protein
MKKLIVIGFFFFGLFSCNDAQKNRENIQQNTHDTSVGEAEGGLGEHQLDKDTAEYIVPKQQTAPQFGGDDQ